MKYCPFCGNELPMFGDTCPHCGQNIKNAMEMASNSTENKQFFKEKLKGIGLVYLIIGLSFPLVGLILFFVMKKTNSDYAKLAGMGALINIIFMVVAFLIELFAEMAIPA